jgi:quercetin dioxygenase-like cupin family protein
MADKEKQIVKRGILVLTVLAGVCSAQQPAIPAAAANAGRGGRGGAPLPTQAPRELPSNERFGIDINRFIGSPAGSMAKVSHETLVTRTIMRNGDPYTPGDPGAVLQYRKDFSVATLMPNNRTPMVQMPEELIFYVENGEGRLDDGKQYWDLHDGVAVLIPPNGAHRLVNTGDKPLTMLMLTWENPQGITPRRDILVRDVNALPFAEKNAHWSYMAKNVFHPTDGLHPNEKILVVYVPPMSMGAPHAHPPQWEEVWTNIGPESSLMEMGSEIREMPANTAMIAPPNGLTVHSVLNTTNKMQAFFYFARYTTPAPTDFKDETVAGKPLK